MNLPRLILVLFCFLFGAATFVAASFFVQMRRDYANLRTQERANQAKLAEATTKLDAQEKYLEKLRHDPALVEQLIRQKLGYAKSEEFVFRFEPRQQK